MKNLGKFLVQKSIITEHQLSDAKQLIEQYGSTLEEVLLTENFTNPYKLYSAIAEHENLEFADLTKYPSDIKLLDSGQRDIYNYHKAIPWKQDGDITIIATHKITPSLQKWADDNFTKYRFAISSIFDIHHNLNEIFTEHNNKDAITRLWQIYPHYSARDLFKGLQRRPFLLFFILVMLTFISFPKETVITTFILISLFYGTTLALKTLLFFVGTVRSNQTTRQQKCLDIPNKDLPIYTILVPLYKEDKVLKKLTTAIKNLDYPKSKLDVKLIVEADDELTINAIKALKCPRIFEMIKVPYSAPRTKPKACNYALRFARGDYVTIYDAEDVPDPLQLKKVLYTFYNSSEEIKCIQAKLNFFNYGENLLSRLFALEYSTLFDFVIFGLEALHIPIPLGGTSNHFRRETLNELYAWDPYNVTEDADIGLRLAQRGWKCKIVDSLTLEECPIDAKSWIRQRSRWIKGHMQTYFVHMRSPLKLYRKIGFVGFTGIQFFLGAPVLIFMISPIMWCIFLLFITGILQTPAGMPQWFFTMVDISIWMLAFGATIQTCHALAATYKHKWPGMLPYCFAFPLYWILHSIASFRALWQLITRPYYWEKTNHGVTTIEMPT